LKWAAIVVFVITFISGLASAPALFVDDLSVVLLNAISLVEAIAVCWLLLLKSTRQALR
jgi:hypothetical protein